MAILYIEDDELTRSTVADRLRRRGYEVVEAASGEAALEVADGTPLEAVIVDLDLPGIDGMEAFCRLRKSRPELPAVVCSASMASHTRRPFLEMGVPDRCLLCKPCQFADLLSALETALDGQARRSSS